METEYIDEDDDTKRRKLKAELVKEKRERKRSLAAAALIINNVKEADLKKLAKCKLNPKLMFDVLVKIYGSEENEDLDKLLDDFKGCFFLCGKCGKLAFKSNMVKVILEINGTNLAILDITPTKNLLHNKRKKRTNPSNGFFKDWDILVAKCNNCDNTIYQYALSASIEAF